MEIDQIELPRRAGFFLLVEKKGSGDFFQKCKTTSATDDSRGFEPPYYALLHFVSGVPTLVSKQGNVMELCEPIQLYEYISSPVNR